MSKSFTMACSPSQASGFFYTLEPIVRDEIARGKLRVVLEPYAPQVPGLFLYFPSRAQVSPGLRALVEVAREMSGTRRKSARNKPSRS